MPGQDSEGIILCGSSPELSVSQGALCRDPAVWTVAKNLASHGNWSEPVGNGCFEATKHCRAAFSSKWRMFMIVCCFGIVLNIV